MKKAPPGGAVNAKIYSAVLVDFFNLAGPQAPGAYSSFPDPSVDSYTYALEIRIEAPIGNIVGMRDIVPEHRLLAADFTHFSH